MQSPRVSRILAAAALMWAMWARLSWLALVVVLCPAAASALDAGMTPGLDAAAPDSARDSTATEAAVPETAQSLAVPSLYAADAVDAASLDSAASDVEQPVVAPVVPVDRLPHNAVVEAPVPGTDFIAEARVLMRVAACVGNVALPASWPEDGLRQHCDALRAMVARYRSRWIERTQSYLAQLVPPDLPKRVVYPFGGGDLFTALHAFPSAEEYTTISLENAGDIRGVAALDWEDLGPSLASTRRYLRCLFAVSHSKTTNLRASSHAALAGEITFALVALAVFDYQPVALRYFRLDPEGGIVYLSAGEILAQPSASRFANVEIVFRARQDPRAHLRVYRHFAANLDDAHFVANQPLALHLRGKGRVSVLIKAASYLLWFDTFSHVRSYLLDQAEWMLSDSTGVEPALARAAGFEQQCWGLFHGPFLPQSPRTKRELVALWQASPQRELPFYFGYPDSDGHGHMMVTRRTGQMPATGTTRPTTDWISSGAHWRLATAKGPVHVWRPSGYDAASAGTVVYVHGYHTGVDAAWVQHALAEQFAASKVNALFIVPEAPASSSGEVVWPALSELLAEVERQLPGLRAASPIVAAGHSGAWRTLGLWTDEPRPDRQVASFILLDGFYGMEEKFRAWLAQQDGGGEPRLTLVSRDTAGHAAGFLAHLPAHLPKAKRRAHLPARFRDLTPAERTAPVLEIASQLSHMEIVTSGRVLPLVLRRSSLRPIAATSTLTTGREPAP